MKMNFRSLANSGVRNLIPYKPGKPVEELERELGITSSIKLASNENPLGTSPAVIAMAQEALFKAHIYPDGSCFELKAALTNFFSIDKEQLTIGNGSENILELVVKTYLHQNDNAVISQYAFLTIPILIKSFGVNAKVVKAKNWGHDIPAMIAAVDEKTRVLFLVNPNNPTGTYTNDDDFRLLMSSIPSHVLVVVDEAYAEYINSVNYPNTLKYLAEYPNLLITRTFSKVYGLAALRVGYAISSPEIADMLNRARLPFNVNTIASKAACVALNDQDHVKISVRLNERGKEQLEIGLQKLNIDYIPSIGNFMTLDVADAELIYQKLLTEGVIVRPLNAYDMPKHIRVTVGTGEQNERFLQTLEKLLIGSDSRTCNAEVLK